MTTTPSRRQTTRAKPRPSSAPSELDPEPGVGARLRAIRESYGLSQRALAKKAAVTNGIISMIEQNRSSPSVATLKKILNALPMSLAEFFAADRTEPGQVFYEGKELVEIGGGLVSYRQLGANLKGKAIQILHERLQPGADTGPDMIHHESEEGGIVLRGQLELTVGPQRRVLGPGDGYYFNSRIPHRFRSVGTETCEIVSACSPPTF